MADNKSVPNVGDVPAKDDEKSPAKSGVVKLNPDDKDSPPKLDFLTAEEATAQAKALGGKHSVENLGVAYRVTKGE